MATGTAISTYLGNAILNGTLRNVAYTPVATIYLAVFTSTATTGQLEAGTLTNEVANAGGSAYVRQVLVMNAAASSATANTSLITWTNMPTCTAAFVAIMDASTVGNVLYWSALVQNKALTLGDTFQVGAGNLTLALD